MQPSFDIKAATVDDTAPLEHVIMSYGTLDLVQRAQERLAQAYLDEDIPVTLFYDSVSYNQEEIMPRITDFRLSKQGVPLKHKGYVSDCPRDIGFFHDGSFFVYQGFLDTQKDKDVARYGDLPRYLIGAFASSGKIVSTPFEGGSMISNGELLLIPLDKRNLDLEKATGLETLPSGFGSFFHIDLIFNFVSKDTVLYHRGSLSPDVSLEFMPLLGLKETADRLEKKLQSRGIDVIRADYACSNASDSSSYLDQKLPKEDIEHLKHKISKRIPTLPLYANIVPTGSKLICIDDQMTDQDLDMIGDISVGTQLSQRGYDVSLVDWKIDDGRGTPEGNLWRLGERFAGPRCMTLPIRK